MRHEVQYFQELQGEYQQLLNVLKGYFDTGTVTAHNICSFMDRLHSFWRRRYDSIKYRLESLGENEDCMFFVGGLYPGVADNDHFYFSGLGDNHFVSDPFLKMEGFFRFDSPAVNVEESIECLGRVLLNSQGLLNLKAKRLFILPVFSIAKTDDVEHHKILESCFWGFLSHLLGQSVSSNEELLERYNTFESIESAIKPDLLKALIFTDWDDNKLTLEERIWRWYKDKGNIFYPEFDHPAKAFVSILSMKVMQCVDFLGVCWDYNMMPYVESNMTFHYLALLMGFFNRDSKLKTALEVAIIAFVFRRVLASHIQEFPDFKYWCKLMHERKLLNKIRQEMNSQDIRLMESGPKAIKPIIEKEVIALKDMLNR